MATATPPGAALLLEVVTTRDPDAPTGLRIYADGRYDELSDTAIAVGADGSSQTSRVPLAWRTVLTYSADELAEVRRLIDAADFPALQPRYPAAAPGRVPNTATWRASVGGRDYEVVVEAPGQNSVPALEALYAGLNGVRKLPPSRSEWRVWVGGRFEQRDVNCDVSGVQELRGLVQALLVPRPAAPGAPVTAADLPDLPADAPLVEVLWQEQGRPDERTVLHGDGRLERVVEGQATPLRTLSPAELAAVLEAGAAIDWGRLPDPVCG